MGLIFLNLHMLNPQNPSDWTDECFEIQIKCKWMWDPHFFRSFDRVNQMVLLRLLYIISIYTLLFYYTNCTMDYLQDSHRHPQKSQDITSHVLHAEFTPAQNMTLNTFRFFCFLSLFCLFLLSIKGRTSVRLLDYKIKNAEWTAAWRLVGIVRQQDDQNSNLVVNNRFHKLSICIDQIWGFVCNTQSIGCW